MSSLYQVLKGRAYEYAQLAAGRGNTEAQAAGRRDVYDLIMSDSDHPRQTAFLTHIHREMPEGHRRVLLDGLAREYAGVDGWMEYVARET